MSKKIRVADLPDFDPAEHLKEYADIAAYLSVVIEEGDAGELAHALGVVASARVMSQIAEEAGLGREALVHEDDGRQGGLGAYRVHERPHRRASFSRDARRLEGPPDRQECRAVPRV